MGKTTGNWVKVELDPENDFIETKSGFKLQLDTSYEPEKHIVRIGTVKSAPSSLYYNKDGSGMPWKTEMELQVGDRVAMYFLAVQNCLRKEYKRYIKEGKTFTIFIDYRNIYCVIRDKEIIPINGYVLVEHKEDPEWEEMKERIGKSGIVVPDMRKLSKTNVSYGKIAYIGKPIQEYLEPYKSDEGYDLNVGDDIIMKKIRDIPVEFEYHARLDGGRKLYRMQRHDIVAKI